MRKGDNIRLRADGRWEARYSKGRDGAGRLLYGCCYGLSREEAAQKREAALAVLPVREMKLLILGAGGHGQVIRELAEKLGVFRRIAFLDDDPKNELAIGKPEACAAFLREYPIALPSVGDGALRQSWMERLAAAGFVLPVLIHPTASVSPTAEIAYGTVVEAGAVVGPGARVGAGCIVSSGATVGRGAVVPPYTLVDCGEMLTALNGLH